MVRERKRDKQFLPVSFFFPLLVYLIGKIKFINFIYKKTCDTIVTKHNQDYNWR